MATHGADVSTAVPHTPSPPSPPSQGSATTPTGESALNVAPVPVDGNGSGAQNGEGGRAMGHTPPRVTTQSAYSSYFKRISHFIPTSVSSYWGGAAPTAGTGVTAKPPPASERLLGCSLQPAPSTTCKCCCSTTLNSGSSVGSAGSPGFDSPFVNGGGGRGFEKNETGLYLCMCYTSGFQVWAVQSSSQGSFTGKDGGDSSMFREVLSIRDGKPVRQSKILVPPCTSAIRSQDGGDGEASLQGVPTLHASMPLVATLSAQDTPDFGLDTVRLFSLTTGRYVHTLRLTEAVHDVFSNQSFIIVCTVSRVHFFDALRLEQVMDFPCYPSPPGLAALALGDRWVAHAAVSTPPGSGNQRQSTSRGNGGRVSGVAGSDVATGVSGGGASVGGVHGGHDEAGDSGLWGVWNVAKQISSGLYGLKGVGEQTLSLVRTVGGVVAGAAGVGGGGGASGGAGEQPPGVGGGVGGARYNAGQPGDAAPVTGGSRTTTQRRAKPAPPPPREAAGCVIIRDTATRRVIAHFRSHWSPLVAMAFDASGSMLATVAVEGQTIHVHQIMPAGFDVQTSKRGDSSGVGSRSDGGSGSSGSGGGVRGGDAGGGALAPGGEDHVDASGSSGHSRRRRPVLRQHRLLFKLERGLTHALVSSLVFSAGGAWLAATSSHGTTHVFSMASTQLQRAGGPPGIVVPSDDEQGDGASSSAVAAASLAVAPPPVPSHTQGAHSSSPPTSQGTLSGFASRFGAALGLRGSTPLDGASAAQDANHVAASMQQYPATIAQKSYLAAWEHHKARSAGPVVRGPCLRVRHVSATPARTAASTNTVQAATGSAGVTAGLSAPATGAAPTTGGGVGVGGGDTTIAHPSMSAALFLGNRSQFLVAASWGLLSAYSLRVDEGGTAMAADGEQVAASTQVGVWDMCRRVTWREVHQPSALLPGSAICWNGTDNDGDDDEGLPHPPHISEELRAHWLSHADINTHTRPVLPLWGNPMFTMYKMNDKATSSTSNHQRRHGRVTSASGAPQRMSMDDLFLDTSRSKPVIVRRAGPQPVFNTAPASGPMPMSATVVPDGSNNISNNVMPPPLPGASAPAPSAPSLALSIRQAVETPMPDSFANDMSVDPPTEAPAVALPAGRVGLAAPILPDRVSSGSSGESGLALALVSQQDDYFAAERRTRNARIARVHGHAVDANAAAAAALFGGVADEPSPGREHPHLISMGSSVLPSPGGDGGGDNGDEPPPSSAHPARRPTPSPRGSTPETNSTHPSRRSSGDAWGAQDAAWLDSHLAGRGLPVGQKVVFDASNPNVVHSDDDDDDDI